MTNSTFVHQSEVTTIEGSIPAQVSGSWSDHHRSWTTAGTVHRIQPAVVTFAVGCQCPTSIASCSSRQSAAVAACLEVADDCRSFVAESGAVLHLRFAAPGCCFSGAGPYHGARTGCFQVRFVHCLTRSMMSLCCWSHHIIWCVFPQFYALFACTLGPRLVDCFGTYLLVICFFYIIKLIDLSFVIIIIIDEYIIKKIPKSN